MERCSRCIVPDTFPGVELDEQGVCSLCSNHTPSPVLGEASLRTLLATRKGSTYDCVVPISGGKDSTFVLYYAATVLELRAIAVMYDSGFHSDLARRNAQRACDLLGVPLVVKAANRVTQTKMLKALLRIAEIGGSFFNTCMNCEANIRAVAINTARQLEVPFILHGASRLEKAGTPPFTRRKTFLKKVPALSRPRLFYHLAGYCLHSIRQRVEMQLPWRLRFLPKGNPRFPDDTTRTIRFYDYVEWNRDHDAALLREKLGWTSPPGRDHRFDCSLHCLANRQWLQGSGITWDGFVYAAMAREERITRQEALSREQAVIDRLEQECRETIEKAGLRGYPMPALRP